MTFALLATSAIVPSLILVWFFHARDAFPEPPRWTVIGFVPAALGAGLFLWGVARLNRPGRAAPQGA